MNKILESYAGLGVNAFRQGKNLHDLVIEQGDWLEQEFPGVIDRYGHKVSIAARNIVRIASGEVLKAFILHNPDSGKTIGIATIISGQSIVHPDEGIQFGADLDYWVTPGESRDTHTTIADELVHETVQWPSLYGTIFEGKPRSYSRKTQFDVFAVVPTDHPNKPIGLMGDLAGGSRYSLSEIGDPAVLTIPNKRTDEFDITKLGRVAQLYTATGLLSERI